MPSAPLLSLFLENGLTDDVSFIVLAVCRNSPVASHLRVVRYFDGHGGPIPARIVVEEVFLEDGHIQQKYSKLTADLHTKANFILHLDSDLR